MLAFVAAMTRKFMLNDHLLLQEETLNWVRVIFVRNTHRAGARRIPHLKTVAVC